jgi:uncharacterized protein YutE (UPF0331/DUF86 family)
MVDREIFSRRLEALHAYLRKLAAFRDAGEDEFVREPALHDLAERYLHLAVKAVLDLGNHWIADRERPTPDTNRDTFTVLENAGEIPSDLAHPLRAGQDSATSSSMSTWRSCRYRRTRVGQQLNARRAFAIGPPIRAGRSAAQECRLDAHSSKVAHGTSDRARSIVVTQRGHMLRHDARPEAPASILTHERRHGEKRLEGREGRRATPAIEVTKRVPSVGCRTEAGHGIGRARELGIQQALGRPGRFGHQTHDWAPAKPTSVGTDELSGYTLGADARRRQGRFREHITGCCRWDDREIRDAPIPPDDVQQSFDLAPQVRIPAACAIQPQRNVAGRKVDRIQSALEMLPGVPGDHE